MKATYIQSCLFVQTPSNRAFTFENGNPVDVRTEELSNSERTAFIAVQDAFNMATSKHGAFRYDAFACPWDWANNNVVMADNGLFTFPSAVITAQYPDGTERMYVLGKEFIDKLTGGIWTAEKIYPYIKVLLLGTNTQQQQTTVLCKLLPPLCSVGGWVWFGLAIGATLKAKSSNSISKGLWGTGAAFLWYEWYQRGGLNQLKSTVGIGKYYDDDKIKPGRKGTKAKDKNPV